MNALRGVHSPHPLVWGFLGLLVAVAVQFSQAHALGGWEGLLAVGESSTLRLVVEDQLGADVVTTRTGHDGHVMYVVALDPSVTWGGEIIDYASYRYRRILFPALAGLFGLIQGWPLFWALTSINALAFAGASYATARLSALNGWSFWAPLAVILNVGLWLSLQITSPDVLAFSLTLFGLLNFRKEQTALSWVQLALAAITKEVYVLFPLALAAYLWWMKRDRQRSLAYVTSALPLVFWSLYLVIRLPEPFGTGGNLTWPLGGVIAGARIWLDNSVRDNFLLALALIAAVAAASIVIRRPRSMWAWLSGPWLLLALVSSHWLWDFGNNALRGFLPLVTLSLFGVLDRGVLRERAQASTSRRNLPV